MIPCKHYQTSLYHFCGITFPNKVWLTYWTEKNNPHSDFLADSTVLQYTTQMFCALPIFSHTESWKQKHALLRVNFYSFIKDILSETGFFIFSVSAWSWRKNFSGCTGATDLNISKQPEIFIYNHYLQKPIWWKIK